MGQHVDITDQPTAEPAAEKVVVEAKPGSQLNKTTGDAFRSIGLVLLVVLGVLFLSWRAPVDPVHDVDVEPLANLAARESSFKVLIPDLAQEGWRPTSARLEPTEFSADNNVWYTGWVSPDDEFAALVQSAATNSGFIAEQTGQGTVVGTVPNDAGFAAGCTRYESRNGRDRALVDIGEKGTTIVVGTQDWAGLEAFAESLVRVGQQSPG